MSARDEILNRLRQVAREQRVPGPWRSRRDFEDLAQRFSESLRAARGELILSADLEQALTELAGVLEEVDARRVVANQESPLDHLNLPQRLPAYDWHLVGRSQGDLRRFCAEADVGLSSAAAALAETGTLVLHTGPGRSRLATLLPPLHVALVPSSRLTTDLFTWVAQQKNEREKGMPANVVLVSGPSKTADIEQTLSVGVHGPRRFVVILYREEQSESDR